jgi:hypothetical protein
MRRLILVAFALAIVFCLAFSLAPTRAGAVDYPTRKAGLWELTMTMSVGRTVTMSQCTDPAVDKDMIANANPNMQQMCTRTELQKTATGYASDATCKFGAMTTVSHTEVSGDFNAAYTVTVTGHNSGGPADIPADMNMTMTVKWIGPCKADQTPGDMIMPGGMKMNVKDMQKMRGMTAPAK